MWADMGSMWPCMGHGIHWYPSMGMGMGMAWHGMGMGMGMYRSMVCSMFMQMMINSNRVAVVCNANCHTCM